MIDQRGSNVPLEPPISLDSHLRSSRPRLLIFIVAYNAETTVKDVLTRIPHALADHCAFARHHRTPPCAGTFCPSVAQRSKIIAGRDHSGQHGEYRVHPHAVDALLGQFNYGKRGNLDMTHTRLFTFGSLRALFEQGGFRVLETRGIPAPFPLALGNNSLARLLLRLNRILIHLLKRLFSYQIIMVAKPYPSLEWLLQGAEEQSAVRAGSYLRGDTTRRR
jgi:hypothetical protein